MQGPAVEMNSHCSSSAAVARFSGVFTRHLQGQGKGHVQGQEYVQEALPANKFNKVRRPFGGVSEGWRRLGGNHEYCPAVKKLVEWS